jgi:hypothetical protein
MKVNITALLKTEAEAPVNRENIHRLAQQQ